MAGAPLVSIVEDDQSVRNALVRLVRSLGYDARGFGSAEAFLTSDAVPDCACVITDVQMSGMSGIELSQQLGTRPAAPPVIVISARTEPGLQEAALASGAICFLRKPLDPQALVECLGKALQS